MSSRSSGADSLVALHEALPALARAVHALTEAAANVLEHVSIMQRRAALAVARARNASEAILAAF